jgi:Kef-type K+ transport system membrane component KefB
MGREPTSCHSRLLLRVLGLPGKMKLPSLSRPASFSAASMHLAFASLATPTHADPVVPLLLALILFTLGAAIGGRVMTALRQPAVLGELLVGVAAGNIGYWLGSPAMTALREGENLRRIADLALAGGLSMGDAAFRVLPPAQAERVAAALHTANGVSYIEVYSFLDLLARIAILLLLFLVGLETSLGEMKRVGKTAFLVAALGVSVPLALGMVTMKLLHPASPLARDLFVGGILTATSVGITARVFRDLNEEHRAESRVVLGAAVIDDVLSLIVLAVVSGLAVSGTVSVPLITKTTLVAGLFLAGSLWLGVRMAPVVVRPLAAAGIRNLKLLFGWSFAFLMAWLANAAGLATIVGAFAAGMILHEFFDEELEGESLRQMLAPVEFLVVPLFFVWIGIQVKLESMFSPPVLLTAAALTLVAILGKVVSGFGSPWTMNRLAIGIGMVPRGEVGLIFAGIGKSIGVVDDALFSAIVILVMITTLAAPLGLRWALRGRGPKAPEPASAAAF